jgi:hypothetical protein
MTAQVRPGTVVGASTVIEESFMNRTHNPQPRLARRAASLAASLALALAAGTTLVACGGSSSTSTTSSTGSTSGSATTVSLTGTAAVGAAIANATVTATNASGVSATTTTAADGSFSIDISEDAPYVLSVVDGSGNQWFSYSVGTGVVNITPLTTLALLNANNNAPLEALANNWANAYINADAVAEAAARVNANLATVMNANGLDAGNYNIFNTAFTVGTAGYDAVLDAMRVSFQCSANSCTETINTPSGTTLVTWNANIDTAGYTISWTGTGPGAGGTVTVSLGSCAAPQSGTYSLLVNTTVAGAGTPEVCIDGLQAKPANENEFCGSTDVVNAMPQGVTINSCSFDGTNGTITATITSPITISYTIHYEYVLAP